LPCSNEFMDIHCDGGDYSIMINKTVQKILILMMGSIGIILAIDPVVEIADNLLPESWMKLVVGLVLTGLTIFLSKEWGVKR